MNNKKSFEVLRDNETLKIYGGRKEKTSVRSSGLISTSDCLFMNSVTLKEEDPLHEEKLSEDTKEMLYAAGIGAGAFGVAILSIAGCFGIKKLVDYVHSKSAKK